MAQELERTASEVSRFDSREERQQVGPVFRPPTDIFENEDAVVLVIDLPGVTPDTVDVSVENRSLTVRGVIEAPAPEGYQRIYAEYVPGTFERVFSLPRTIDTNAIEASHRDGVVTLTLKKSETAKPKRIEVRAA